MQRVLVVLLVAGPEQDRVVPAQEAHDGQKERVERLRLEDGLVAQLVETVQKQRPTGPVYLEDQQEHGEQGNR